MKDATRDFLVGAVCLAGVLSLAALMMVFGELDPLLNPRYRVQIFTDHAAGLRKGSTVELNGVPIGAIELVAVERDEHFPVRVVALIDEHVTIPGGAVPYASTSILGGSSILEMVIEGTNGPSLPKDGSAVIRMPIRYRMIEQIAKELDARMKPIIETLTGFGDALDGFEELSKTYTQLGKRIDGLLEPQAESAIDGGEQANLRSAIHQFYEVLRKSEEALDLARAWLGDEQLRADAAGAVSKASALIEKASATLERYSALADKLGEDADTLVANLVPVTDQLDLTLEEVRRLVRLATEGEGTVGLLLNEPDLYRSLADAAQRLDVLLREMTLLVQKIKAEGLPVNF